jgi:hypothetical protein
VNGIAPTQALVGGHRKSRPALLPALLHSLAQRGIRPGRPSERACGFMRTSEPGRRRRTWSMIPRKRPRP